MEAASLGVAIVAILIALASVYFTRQHAIAASMTAANDTKRLHDALTPQFKTTCVRPGADSVAVSPHDLIVALELTGPVGLDQLEEVTIRIREHDRDKLLRGDMSDEQVASMVWAPYRFAPRSRLTDERGSQHGPFRLPKQEPYQLVLQPTITGVSENETRLASWYAGQPIQLQITCSTGQYEPWAINREITKADIA